MSKIFNHGDRVYHTKLKMSGIFLEQDHQNADIGNVEFIINGVKEIRQVKGEDLIKYELFYESLNK